MGLAIIKIIIMDKLSEQDLLYLGELRSFAAVADWKMTSNDALGIEFTRKKNYSTSTLIWGGIFILLAGLGLLVLIWGLFEYLCKRDEIMFIPMSEIRDRAVDCEKFKWR